MFENLIVPTLNQLRQTVDSWIDEEFKDLENEISYVDSFAPTDEATTRIDGFGKEIAKIQNEELPRALRQLDYLIEYIKQQKYESAEDFAKKLFDNAAPIFSVMSSLVKTREKLDSMADMISVPAIEEAQTDK